MHGGYELIEELGRGAMGSVHLARKAGGERLVALKVLHPHLASSADLRRRFQREISLCIKLQHPAIIKVLDAGEMEGCPFYTMEYLEGAVPLNALIAADGALDLEVALDVMRALLDALAFCHGRGLLHRDLKPANIMVGPADRVTVMDFGLARDLDSTLLTAPGTIIGTPRYLSPEVVRGAAPSSASDLWSAGTVFYEMLTGRAAFTGKTLSELIREILHTDAPPVSRVRPVLPATLDPLVAAFLDKDPAQRHARAEDALLALDSWTLRHGVAAPETTASAARLRRPLDLSGSGVLKRRPTRRTRRKIPVSPDALARVRRGVMGLAALTALSAALVIKSSCAANDASRAPRVTDASPDPSDETVAERGARLRLRLANLDARTHVRVLVGDMRAKRLDGPGWQRHVDGALTSAGVRDAMAAFRPVREAYYDAPDVAPADKSSLHALVQDLIELEDCAQEARLDLKVGARHLESTAYGPITTAGMPQLTATLIAPGTEVEIAPMLGLSPGSPVEPFTPEEGRLRAWEDPRGGERTITIMSQPRYQHPRPLSGFGPGPVEIRAVVERMLPPVGLRVQTAPAPEGPWSLLAHLRPLVVRRRHVLRYRVPAGVAPQRPFWLRIEIAYLPVRPLTSKEPEQVGWLDGLAFSKP